MRSERLEIVIITIKVLFVALLMAGAGMLLASHQALGYLITEVEPGIAEIKQGQDGALVIDEVSFDRKKKWIYFAVREKTRLSSKFSSKQGQVRYFYASARDFKIAPNMKVSRLQFGLQKRIGNIRGRIPFGGRKYFYPLLDYST